MVGDLSGVERKESKPGRKGFEPTDAQRETVRLRASERLGHEIIAEEIGVSVPTLRKYFRDELKERLGGDNLFVAAGAASPETAPAPTRPKRTGSGGRKRYEPSSADREKVAVLIGSGMTIEEIAKAMAISEPTLNRHYRSELETGALRKRGEMLVALHRVAGKGNVAAIKEVLSIMDRANLENLQDRLRGKSPGKTGDAPATPAPASSSDPVGKKVQAEIDAHGVVESSAWADVIRFPPKAK